MAPGHSTSGARFDYAILCCHFSNHSPLPGRLGPWGVQDWNRHLNLHIITATSAHATVVASLITALTWEICDRCNDQSQFAHDEALTAQLCARWIDEGIYTVLLACSGDLAVGVVTIAESHALYAEGKIGIIQECYVLPAYRNQAAGSALLEAALGMAQERGWACMELCTPPLPEFANALEFYQRHAFVPVGGRKMRVRCSSGD
jgi:GNAT superfamily N-acetyltransferase